MFQRVELLLAFQFLQSSDGRLSCASRHAMWVQPPPATIFMQAPQCQSPTAHLFILVLPQKDQAYSACWLTSIFFTIFLTEAPLQVLYLLMIPTFLAHLAMFPQTRTEPRQHPPSVFVKFYWNMAMSSHSWIVNDCFHPTTAKTVWPIKPKIFTF